MSETDIPTVEPEITTDDTGSPVRSHALLAALCAGAGVIHFVMVPTHADLSLSEGLGFAAFAWAQVTLAYLLLTRGNDRRVLSGAVAVNAVALGLWAWARTSGLPFGSHEGVAEEVQFVDLTTALLEGAAVLGAAAVLLRPGQRMPAQLRYVPALAAVAVFGITTAALASPSAVGHGGPGHDNSDGHHGDTELASGDHAHGDPADHADGHGHGATAVADDDRCDLAFNPQAFWDEADFLQAVHDGGVEAPDVDTALMDELLGMTQKEGELAAAELVNALAEASDEEYEAFLYALASEGVHGDHGSHGGGNEAAPDDNHGAGGHMGPQTWQPITDTATCEQLESEIQIARDVALSMPTPVEARANGYRMVTPYVSGIAAHYMNFAYLRDAFVVDQPEMVLYDGNGDDASIIGLSYFIIHQGDDEPTSGFTGPNDHYHRHVGLCMKDGMVIGDTTVSKEDCEARGGRKNESSAGWMSHAWVVPGCESPWGVFSAANPVLDGQLSLNSGQGDPCSGSGTRSRYDLSTGAPGD